MILEWLGTKDLKIKVSAQSLAEVQNCNNPEGDENSRYSMWSFRDIETELQSEVSSLCLLKKDQNQLQGFIFYQTLPFERDSKEVWILHWAVGPKGQGLGLKFLKDFVDSLSHQSSSVQQVGLEVNSKNSAAIEIYRRLGFSRLAERKDYYKEGGDAWGMRLSLNLKP